MAPLGIGKVRNPRFEAQRVSLCQKVHSSPHPHRFFRFPVCFTSDHTARPLRFCSFHFSTPLSGWNRPCSQISLPEKNAVCEMPISPKLLDPWTRDVKEPILLISFLRHSREKTLNSTTQPHIFVPLEVRPIFLSANPHFSNPSARSKTRNSVGNSHVRCLLELESLA